MTNYGKGLIGIPTGELTRWGSFWGCHAILETPPGTEILPSRGSSPASNRNAIVTEALRRGVDWVFFLDDDMTFPSDVLMRLLARDVDIVAALTYHREAPHRPLWWTQPPDPETKRLTLLHHDEIRRDGALQRLAGCTSGGLLVKTTVLRGLDQPLWTLGQFVADEWYDDVWFSEIARAAGFHICGDPTVHCGHTTNVEVWPQVSETGEFRILLARGQQRWASWSPVT